MQSPDLNMEEEESKSYVIRDVSCEFMDMIYRSIVFFCGYLVSPTRDSCGLNSETAEHHDLDYS